MSSRFRDIFEARNREAGPEVEGAAPPSPAPPEPAPKAPKPAPSPKPAAEPRKRGRPSGKRSDGEHVQVTAYIRRETHKAVKLALLNEDRGQEFSELVQGLLAKWLKSRA